MPAGADLCCSETHAALTCSPRRTAGAIRKLPGVKIITFRRTGFCSGRSERFICGKDGAFDVFTNVTAAHDLYRCHCAALFPA